MNLLPLLRLRSCPSDCLLLSCMQGDTRGTACQPEHWQKTSARALTCCPISSCYSLDTVALHVAVDEAHLHAKYIHTRMHGTPSISLKGRLLHVDTFTAKRYFQYHNMGGMCSTMRLPYCVGLPLCMCSGRHWGGRLHAPRPPHPNWCLTRMHYTAAIWLPMGAYAVNIPHTTWVLYAEKNTTQYNLDVSQQASTGSGWLP